MGSAMLAGWRERGMAPPVVVDPTARVDGVAVVGSSAAVPADFVPSAVVLAVKPQNAAATLPDYARYGGSAVFLSIMAGKTIAGLGRLLGAEAAVVRAMPNTPAAVRQGVTVAVAGAVVSRAQLALCDTLLQAIGAVAWVEDEGLIDPVTAVSGGGPRLCFPAGRTARAGGNRAGHSRRSGASAGAADGQRIGCLAGGER